MTEKEAAAMLTNMRLAAPDMDSALVELLAGWAQRGLHASPEPKVCMHADYAFTWYVQDQ